MSLMSNIDTNLAKRVLKFEYLSALPPNKPLKPLATTPDRNSEFPKAGQPHNFDLDNATLKVVKAFLNPANRPDLHQYIRHSQINCYKKFHIKFGFSVGSETSQGSHQMYRRDDSYIYWKEAQKKRCFGRVIVYFTCATWDPLAIVCPVKVEKERASGLLTTNGKLQGRQIVNIQDIEGLFGMIVKGVGAGKKTYLVGVEEA